MESLHPPQAGLHGWVVFVHGAGHRTRLKMTAMRLMHLGFTESTTSLATRHHSGDHVRRCSVDRERSGPPAALFVPRVVDAGASVAAITTATESPLAKTRRPRQSFRRTSSTDRRASRQFSVGCSGDRSPRGRRTLPLVVETVGHTARTISGHATRISSSDIRPASACPAS